MDFDVGEEPEGAGAGCLIHCTPLLLRMLPPLGILLLLQTRSEGLEVEVGAAVAAAAAAVARVATTCLGVDEVDVCDVNPEAKAGATNPGGRRP